MFTEIFYKTFSKLIEEGYTVTLCNEGLRRDRFAVKIISNEENRTYMGFGKTLEEATVDCISSVVIKELKEKEVEEEVDE